MGQLLIRASVVLTFCYQLNSVSAVAGMLTFDEAKLSFVHGSVISLPQLQGSTNPLGSLGITVTAHSERMDNHGYAIIYDSRTRNGRDPDLESPWGRGNVDSQADLGNLLIVAENIVDGNKDGIVDNPDDEGRRPAGSITFEFDYAITEIGFDLIDVEGSVEYLNRRGYVAALYADDQIVGQVGFGQFIDKVTTNNPFYDASVKYGNNSANRIQPIRADQFGSITSFNKVVFDFGGSGAIDNINWKAAPVPAPPTVVLALMAGVCGFLCRKQLQAKVFICS